MKKNPFLMLSFLFAMLFSVSCSKDRDPGPVGPQGPQGEVGTANVMYSNWLDFDWNYEDEEDYKAMLVSIPEITAAFLENGGVVLVYFKGTESASLSIFAQLPWVSPYESVNFRIVVSDGSTIEGFERGIVISHISMDGTVLGDLQDKTYGDFSFRYILIPGGVNLQSAGKLAPIDYDYTKVKERFNIPD